MIARLLPLSGLIGLAALTTLPALAQNTRPPAQVTVTNARTVPLTLFEIATGGEQPRLVAKLQKPLEPGKSTTLRLNKPQGCTYFLLGRFADDVENDADGWDLCTNRTIRLTD